MLQFFPFNIGVFFSESVRCCKSTSTFVQARHECFATQNKRKANPDTTQVHCLSALRAQKSCQYRTHFCQSPLLRPTRPVRQTTIAIATRVLIPSVLETQRSKPSKSANVISVKHHMRISSLLETQFQEVRKRTMHALQRSFTHRKDVVRNGKRC